MGKIFDSNNQLFLESIVESFKIFPVWRHLNYNKKISYIQRAIAPIQFDDNDVNKIISTINAKHEELRRIY